MKKLTFIIRDDQLVSLITAIAPLGVDFNVKQVTVPTLEVSAAAIKADEPVAVATTPEPQPVVIEPEKLFNGAAHPPKEPRKFQKWANDGSHRRVDDVFLEWFLEHPGQKATFDDLSKKLQSYGWSEGSVGPNISKLVNFGLVKRDGQFIVGHLDKIKERLATRMLEIDKAWGHLKDYVPLQAQQ